MENHNSFKHIFLVDDDEDDRVIFAEALLEIDSSYTISEAENGVEMMEFLYRQPMPDLLFLDLNMPKRGGLECLQEIKTNDRGLQNLKIVILTTSSNPNNIEAAYQLGAAYYAIKPNNFKGMKSLIKNVLDIDWQQTFPAERSEFVIG